MIKSLITRRVANISRTPNAFPITCDKTYDSLPDGNIDLEAGKSYCFPSTGFFVIGANKIKLTTVSETGVESTPVNDALGAISKVESGELVKTYYKLVSENVQTVFIFPNEDYSQSYSSELNGKKVTMENKIYLPLQKNVKQTVSFYLKASSKEVKYQTTALLFVNPNEATITANNGKGSMAYFDGAKITEKLKNKKSGDITIKPEIDITEPVKLEDGTYKATSEITIEGNTGSYTLPEKLFELTSDTIYSISTKNAKMVNFVDTDADTGLSGGIIAVIVIVCIIAVAAIAFCVYWFVFRNKATDQPLKFNP